MKDFMKAIGRYRLILDRNSNEPYLERYYLFLKDRKYFPFNIFLHKFLKNDPDDLHDHPWSYFTLILRGGYWEHTLTGKHWRGPGHCRISSAESYHRIEIDPNVNAWTLFIPGIQKREWGFLVDGITWTDHKTYLDRLAKKYN